MVLNLKKNGFHKVIIFSLLVVVCAALLPFTVTGNTSTNENVSSKINIGKVNVTYYENDTWNVYMTDGAVIEPDKIFTKGTTMKFYVTWSVSSDQINDIDENDFFYVDMPTSYFTFSDLGPIEVKDPNDVLIGYYSVSNQTMKFVFSDIVDNKSVKEVKNGWLMAKGSLSVSEIPGNVVSMGGIIIPAIATKPAVEPGDESSDVYPLNPPERPDPDPLLKGRQMDDSTQTAHWYLEVNHDMYKAKYDGLETFAARENVVIEDKLEDGQKFKNIQMFHKYYYSTAKGKMSDYSFNVYYDIDDTFTLIEEYSNEDYDAFRKRVIESGQNGSKPAYGIWQDKNIIISMGDIPGKLDMPLNRSELESKLSTQKYNGQSIPESIQEKTMSAYDKFFSSTLAGSTAKAHSLNLRISAAVSGEDRTIENTAYMYWDTDNQESSSTNINYESIAGGAELGIPGSVTIRKYDHKTDDILDGVEFKLQKQEGGSNNYVDYTPVDGIVTKVTSGGSVVFTDLDYGKYKVVEVSPIAGYQDKITFKDGDGTFIIDGNESGTIYIDAYNYKKDEKSIVTPGAVLGEEDTPTFDDSSVLGEESKTADVTNLTLILLVTLVVMIIMLIISIHRVYKRD